MKLIATLVIALGATFASAQSFELIKDGTTYSCTEKTASNPNAVADCVYKAKYSASLSNEQAIRLCQGATNMAPADCVHKAKYSVSLSTDQALSLCVRAKNVAPADCAYKAKYSVSLSNDQAIKLCYGAVSLDPADCAYKAKYSSSLSSDEAVDLCKISGGYVINGVQFVQRNSYLNSLQVFKNKFNLFQ
jgi:hypothetical protein